MSDAIIVLVAFVFGCITAYYVLRSTVGARCWHDGYLHGFNLAWDEKTQADEAARLKKLKEIRKKRPYFEVIKGDK